MQISDTPATAPTTTAEKAPKKPRKTFAQQMAELKAKQEKMLEGAARKIAKANKDENPQLAEAAAALETLKRALKLLKKFRGALGENATLEDAVGALSHELAQAAPALLAKMEASEAA